ncbi:MAG: hypothetical protein KJ799_03170 [Bacteroidetes bacterium]|nr:hypothetical protein [Bacteroidota bacterium]MBU1681147.1 hypothetical protein [Bacteroidota bacterium]MBU2505709.1 hypothetical protein [Bacteroidota bacterium]
MEDKFYIEEKEFKETIDLLKSLPKVKAPENFEFNLMTKIHNKNFKSSSKRSVFAGWSVYLKPSFALVASAVLVYFLFVNETNDFENPLLSQPKVREDAAFINSDTILMQEAPKEEIFSGSSENAKSKTPKPQKQDVYKVIVQPNDAVSKYKLNFPFNDGKTVDVDKQLQGQGIHQKGSKYGTLAGGGDKRFSFEGFSLIEKDTSANPDSQVAKQDSLKNKTSKN